MVAERRHRRLAERQARPIETVMRRRRDGRDSPRVRLGVDRPVPLATERSSATFGRQSGATVAGLAAVVARSRCRHLSVLDVCRSLPNRSARDSKQLDTRATSDKRRRPGDRGRGAGASSPRFSDGASPSVLQARVLGEPAPIAGNRYVPPGFCVTANDVLRSLFVTQNPEAPLVRRRAAAVGATAVLRSRWCLLRRPPCPPR
jgi:hypothetical protein